MHYIVRVSLAILTLQHSVIALVRGGQNSFLVASEKEGASIDGRRQRLWNGLDDVDTLSAAQTGDSEPGSVTRYMLLGPMDSGTNLLETTVKDNWPWITKFERPWKHGLGTTNDIYDALKSQNVSGAMANETVAIAMLRSPLGTVSGWRKSPYELVWCVQRPVEEYNLGCHVDLSVRRLDPRDDIIFNSTLDVYNAYVHLYLALAKEGKFKKFGILFYEDLVLTPNDVVTALASHFGVEVPPDIHRVSAPAKDHGDAISRQTAVDKIQGRHVLEEFSADRRKLICTSLDREAVRDAESYSFLATNPSERPPYTSDCDEHVGN